MIVSGSYDRTLRVWNVESGALVRVFTGHSTPVTSAALSPGGVRVVSGSDDGTLCVWNANTGVCERKLQGYHRRPVIVTAFSPRGTHIISGSNDGTLCLWSVDGVYVRVLEGHSDMVTNVTFSPDNKYIVGCSSWDQTTHVWNVANGRHELTFYSDRAASVAFSPSGERIISVFDTTVKVWSITGICERTLQAVSDGWINSAALSPGGENIVAGSCYGEVNVWNINTGVCERAFRNRSGVMSVTYSLDGTRIITGSFDTNVRVWNTIIGVCERTLQGHRDWVSCVAFGGSCNVSLVGRTIRGTCSPNLLGTSRCGNELSPDMCHKIDMIREQRASFVPL